MKTTKIPWYIRQISLILVFVLLVQLLPGRVFAAEDSKALLQESSAVAAESETAAEPAYIVHEIPEKRTEYSKEFRLSNGLHMAAVYGESVHYAADGQWQEIDNTLVATASGYRNTAGIWNVSFPQTFSGTNAVTIEKDGYTLSFYLSGQLRRPTLEIIGQENVTVQAVSESAAQVQALDLTAKKAEAQYPETVLEKNHSQLRYNNVFANTYVQYDLAGNQVKESIVIGAYDEALQGYQYTLNTGELIPVLTDSNDIVLLGPDKQTVVMTMPAPYLLDAAGEYNSDVAVSLTGARGVYTLTYTLPRAWMADETRQYPVVLDPVVDGGSNRDNIEDLSVSQTGTVPASLLNVGWTSTRGTMRSFVRFLELPELAASDIIVEATLKLNHVKAASAGFPVGAHRVLAPWSESTLTWANQPAHDPVIEDFSMVVDDDTDYTWDITEIARDWYLLGNTGLMLRGPDYTEQSGTGTHLLQFASESYSIYDIPTLTLTFRSTVGIEPYYTYATLGAGNAGGVYLSDSTGQITAMRQVASYASSVNPFAMNLVYNSANYYAQRDNLTGFFPLRSLGLPVSIGNGWSLDIVQKIEPLTVGETEYLLYHDGDGTRHYLRKSGNKYCDEDGLGLTVVANSDGSYTMSDDMDNRWFFTDLTEEGITGCFLTSTLDNNGNGYEIRYADGKLLSVVQKNAEQSEITVASFTYSNETLTAIVDATGGRYTLGYSGPYLVSVTRVDASGSSTLCAEYTYDTSRLVSMTDAIQDYTLHLEYGALSAQGRRLLSSGRVVAYWEESNGQEGIRCDVSYPGYTQTTYHSYGNDRAKNTADDLYTHYLTDFAGRTVNAYTTDATQTAILGASTAVYTENEGISKKNNRTERTASIGMAAQKLLTGGDFEGATNLWIRTNADIFEADDQNYISHTGHRSFQGILSNTSSVASGYRETEALQANTPYTLSAYIRATSLENFQTDNTALTYGPGVYIKIVTSDGIAYCTEPVNYTTDSTVDSGWVNVLMTFTPQVSGVATAYIIGEGAEGVFYVDDIQLEKGETPSNFNLLENGDLQSDDTTAFGWTLKEDVSFCNNVGVNAEGQGNHSIKIEGDCENKYAYAIQTVYINKKGQQSYVLSGWGKADAVTDNITLRSDPAYDHTKQFGLRATVYYRNDTEGEYTEYFYIPFNPDIPTWQYASLTVTPRSDKYVDHINVSCVYECNANTAWFDNLSFVSTTVEQMEYDDNGNLTSLSSTSREQLNLIYDTDGNVEKIRWGTKLEYTSKYDTTFKHRMISSSNAFTQETMSYDAVGNVIRNSLKNKTDSTSKEIVTSSEYTNSGNLISTETDDAGNTTTYAYSSGLYQAFGIASSVTNAKGIETTYIADTFGRTQEMALENLATIKYNYDGSDLYEIQRIASGASQFYQFNYDSFGNTTSIGVGSHDDEDGVLLVEYTYGPKNGLFTQQKYANGDTVSYAYDDTGRTVAETYKNSAGQTQRVLSYTYTGDGQLYSVHDSKTGYTYQYNYDSTGALLACRVTDSSGNLLLLLRQNPIVDRDGGRHWQLGDTAYTESYVNNESDGSIAAFYAADGTAITLGYDVLRRLASASNGIYTRNYTYRDISASQTTNQVSSVSYSGLTDSPSFGYTYDALGNILTYTENGVTYTYSYDDQSQLLSAVGNGKTYTYSYDNAGNILAVSDGTASHTYTYGNSVWKDLLTAYDGHTITYDASGNPLSYYNGTPWSFTWTEGRKLDTASGNGHTISYTYDLNGLRTSKTVDNTQYSYVYNDGELLRQTGDGKTLDFIYDHDGAPYALIYKNGSAAAETYYYITNLQGDVMQLVDEDGSTAAQYSYDPYGNILSATGDMAEVNPLRYRGYYYDSESGLYYLQSRYYDPAVGRFINADDVDCLGVNGSVISYNLFAYCENNPINQVDTFGYFSIEAILIAGIAGGIWNVAKYAARSFWRFSWRKAIGKFVEGFLTGSIIASLAQLPKSFNCGVLGAVFEVIYYVFSSRTSKQKLSASKILNRALVGYSLGLYSNAVRLVAPKLGLKYDDIATDNFSTKSILYLLAKAAIDGYLTDFFSW